MSDVLQKNEGKSVGDNENACGRPPTILWRRREMAEVPRTQVGGVRGVVRAVGTFHGELILFVNAPIFFF